MKPRQELLGSIRILDKDGYGQVDLSGSKIFNLSEITFNIDSDTGANNSIFVTSGETSSLNFRADDGSVITLGAPTASSDLATVLLHGNTTGSRDIILNQNLTTVNRELSLKAPDGYSVDLKVGAITIARAWSTDFQVLGTITSASVVYNNGHVLTQQPSTPDGVPVNGTATLWLNESGNLVYTNESNVTKEIGNTINVISPAALNANVDNYSPTGLSDSTHVRISASSAYSVSGISASVNVKQKYIINIGSSNITILNDNSSSTAANRILIPGGGDLVLSQNDSITLFYDDASTRWRVI